MWWLFGLINIIVTILFAWGFFKFIKEEKMTRNNKIALGTLCVFAFLGGYIVSVILVGLLIYLIIDFIKFIKNKQQ